MIVISMEFVEKESVIVFMVGLKKAIVPKEFQMRMFCKKLLFKKILILRLNDLNNYKYYKNINYFTQF